MSDLQDMFDAEDAAGAARKEALIRELAERIFVATASIPQNNFSSPVNIEHCFHAAKSFIEYEVNQ